MLMAVVYKGIGRILEFKPSFFLVVVSQSNLHLTRRSRADGELNGFVIDQFGEVGVGEGITKPIACTVHFDAVAFHADNAVVDRGDVKAMEVPGL